MTGSGCMLVVCACGNRTEAEAIASALVEAREAACVQLIAADSIYRWEGAVQRETEVVLHIKTTAARFDAVAQRIGMLHSYDAPEIIAVPIIDGSAAYLDWICSEVA